MGVDFDAAWCGTDLGDHRPCRYTYERYPYDTLPPLDKKQLKGVFQWLGDPGEVVSERAAKMRQLEKRLAAEGLALPKDFVTFHVSSNLRESLDSVSLLA